MTVSIVRALGMVCAFLVLRAPETLACAVCYGDPQSPLTNGMNMAILSLLGITGGVLAAMVVFFVFVRKRARASWNGPVTIGDVLEGRKG